MSNLGHAIVLPTSTMLIRSYAHQVVFKFTDKYHRAVSQKLAFHTNMLFKFPDKIPDPFIKYPPSKITYYSNLLVYYNRAVLKKTRLPQ